MGGQHCVKEGHVQLKMLALASSLAVQLDTFSSGQWSFLGEGKRVSSSFRGCIQQHTIHSESLPKCMAGQEITAVRRDCLLCSYEIFPLLPETATPKMSKRRFLPSTLSRSARLNQSQYF